MTVSAYSLKRTLFNGEARSLTCKTTAGEITILNNHRPLIATLTSCTMKIIDEHNVEKYIAISSGFIEVASNNVKLLID